MQVLCCPAAGLAQAYLAPEATMAQRISRDYPQALRLRLQPGDKPDLWYDRVDRCLKFSRKRYLGLKGRADADDIHSVPIPAVLADAIERLWLLAPHAQELGHLLGLRHTADIKDIMDITASARQMLFDQWHKVADLHSSIMSIGYQDAPTMFSWCVGGTPPAEPDTASKLERTARTAYDADDFYIPREWLAANSVQADEAEEAEEQ